MRLKQFCAVAATVLSIGCAARHGAPVVDPGPKPPNVGGTIAGVVRSSGGDSLTGRTVTAVETANGARFQASTAVNGGYSVQVPVGTYRLEVELRTGEVVTMQPELTDVNAGDLDAQCDFVVTVR